MERTKALKEVLNKVLHNYLVFRSFIAVTFFVIAYVLFTPFEDTNSDLLKIILAIYGFFVIAVSVFLIFEYLTKIIKLQMNTDIKVYSSLVSINTVFGLIFPLFYINVILNNIMFVFSRITNYGTVLCTIRFAMVRFYYSNQIYFHTTNFIMLLVVLTTLLFLFGGFVERLVRHK